MHRTHLRSASCPLDWLCIYLSFGIFLCKWKIAIDMTHRLYKWCGGFHGIWLTYIPIHYSTLKHNKNNKNITILNEAKVEIFFDSSEFNTSWWSIMNTAQYWCVMLFIGLYFEFCLKKRETTTKRHKSTLSCMWCLVYFMVYGFSFCTF